MFSNKISEQFHYFNIKSELDSVFGNWAVSKNGDVVNYYYPYAIFSIYLNNYDMINSIVQRLWNKRENEDDLTKALERARSLAFK